MGWFLGYIWCVCLLLDVVGLCTPMKFKPPGFPGTFGGAWGFLGYSHGWALENPKELGSPGMIEKPFLHISAWASRCWSLNGFLFAQLLILMEKTHSLLLWFVFLLASHCTWSVSQQCVCVCVCMLNLPTPKLASVHSCLQREIKCQLYFGSSRALEAVGTNRSHQGRD